MIYAVCGPASLLSTLVTNVARALLERVHGQIFFYPTNDASELRTKIGSGDIRDGLIAFDVPDDIIPKLVLRARTPTIMVAERSTMIYAFNRHVFGMDYHGAARHLSRIFSVFRPLFDASHVLILSMGDDQPFDRLVRSVASGLHLVLSEETIDAVVSQFIAELGHNATVGDVCMQAHDMGPLIQRYAVSLEAEEAATVTAIDQSYGLLLRQQNLPLLNWPIELTINAENGSPLSSPLELTGPGRLLTFGPYMFLPVGNWRAVITFGTKDNLSSNFFMCDIFSPTIDKVLAVGKAELPVSGFFKTSFEFAVQSAHHFLEFRTFMPIGAIEGILEIVNISMQPLPSNPDD